MLTMTVRDAIETEPGHPAAGEATVAVAAGQGPTLPCLWCHAPVPQRAAGPGRRRRYCAPPQRCQEEAKRARAARRAAGGTGADVAAAEMLTDRLQAFVDRLADAAGIRRAAAEQIARVTAERDAALAEAAKLQNKIDYVERAARAEGDARIEAERQAARVLAERDAAVQARDAALAALARVARPLAHPPRGRDRRRRRAGRADTDG
jgi:hypothetical protein